MQNVERKQKLLNKQNQNIARLKNESGSKNLELEKLRAKKEGAQKTIAQLKKEKLNANSQIAAKNKEINQIKKIQKNMEAAGSLSMQEKEKLRQNLKKAQEEKAGMEMESKLWHNRLLNEQKKLRTAEIERESFRANATQKQIQLNELQEKKNAANTNKATANAARNAALRNKAAANAAAQAAQDELNKKQEEFEKKANKIRNELQKQRNKIQENKKLSNEEKNAALANLRQTMERQQQAQQDIIQEIQKLSNERQETIQKLENRIGILTLNRNKWMQNATAIKNKAAKNLSKKEEEMSLLQIKANKYYKNRSNLEIEFSKKSNNLINKEQKIANMNAEVVAARKNLTNKIKELESAKATLNQKNQNIAQKNQNLQAAANQLRMKNQAITQKNAAVAALQENLNKARELFVTTQKEAAEAAKVAAGARATMKWTKAIGNKKITKLEENTKSLGEEIKRGKNTLTKTQRTLNQTQETLAFEQNQVGRLAKAEQNARGKLKNTQGQLQTTQGQLQTTQGQLQATQEAATLNQRRTQAQLNQARKSAKKFKAAARAQTVNTFNSTAAFQKMGNNLNQAERDKLIRKLEVKIDITSDNGSKYVINDPIPGPFGRLPGAERRALKKEIRTASLERLKEINLMINKRKKEINNFKIDVNTKKTKPATPKQRFGTDNQVKQVMKQTRVNTTQGVNQGKSSMAQMVSKGNAKSQINKLQKIGGKTKIAYKREVNRGANPQNVVKRAKAANGKAKMGRTLQALRAGNAKKGQR